MEFFAEDEPITIIPNFSLPGAERSTLSCFAVRPSTSIEVHCLLRPYSLITCVLQAEYGPFRPNRPQEVPLWLAVQLHTRKKCRIQPPDWMDADRLQRERRMSTKASVSRLYSAAQSAQAALLQICWRTSATELKSFRPSHSITWKSRTCSSHRPKAASGISCIRYLGPYLSYSSLTPAAACHAATCRLSKTRSQHQDHARMLPFAAAIS